MTFGPNRWSAARPWTETWRLSREVSAQAEAAPKQPSDVGRPHSPQPQRKAPPIWELGFFAAIDALHKKARLDVPHIGLESEELCHPIATWSNATHRLMLSCSPQSNHRITPFPLLRAATPALT